MKKPLVLGIAVLALAGFAAAASSSADTSEDNPEFYFTRLVYTENGRMGGFGRGGTMEKPDPYLCPEFGGGNFFPPQGWGWATDTPGADCKLMGAIHRLTGQRVYPNPNYVEILEDELFKFPYAYIVEPGHMTFSDKEARRLREYLDRGGFLHLDDFWGINPQKQNVIDEIAKVFPERPVDRLLEPLPLSHPFFHTFFDITEIVQTPNERYGCDGGETWEQADDKEPAVYGISDANGRLMVVVSYNTDLGDAWEYMDRPCYPEKYSHYAIRFALNSIVYAMTH